MSQSRDRRRRTPALPPEAALQAQQKKDYPAPQATSQYERFWAAIPHATTILFYLPLPSDRVLVPDGLPAQIMQASGYFAFVLVTILCMAHYKFGKPNLLALALAISFVSLLTALRVGVYYPGIILALILLVTHRRGAAFISFNCLQVFCYQTAFILLFLLAGIPFPLIGLVIFIFGPAYSAVGAAQCLAGRPFKYFWVGNLLLSQQAQRQAKLSSK